MKRILWITLLLCALTGALVACGGSTEPPAQPAEANEIPAVEADEEMAVEDTPAPADEEAPVEEAAPAGEDAPATEEAVAEEGAADGGNEAGDMIAGRPASGIDPDTGLEINPPTVVPGVDFIVRGEIINANLTPQDSPEFVILSPSGTRFRIRSQPVPDISYEDGTQPALHEFQRGVLIQATVRQEEGAGATITVQSTDLTLLHDQ
ncbi:MAG: hypothetical protein KC410_01915 [Anaerolineales bacterium]|uniref:hypothetical protein n=1 Tax=Promineifilum sp. TaxID=2664178 RepID=UPI001D2E945D|nr:hypothetical protein [Anaerolineales bacterium]MCB8936188.1 hypothetical protein [Promineifilum sp.]MCO5178648.1 hypothetical protein [Promineifilum sp.]